MPRQRIAVASLGGTITMTSADSNETGVRPTLSAEQLLATVPGLSDVAELHATTLNTAPSASLTYQDVLRGLDWARDQIGNGAAGAVLIQGTDTIEETAYLLDLYWDLPAPLVVTGAMRPPQAPGADGPANVMAAVRVACADGSRGRGVMVVLNDEIHAASRVRKTQASQPNAFVSPVFGPLGYVTENQPVYGDTAAAAGRRTVPRPDSFVTPRVALLETFLEDHGELLETVADNEFHGVVLAGFGVGHVSAACAEVVERVSGTIPVILATRTGAGSTHQSSYGFPGSESDLIAKGAIPAGWLDARKARILLTCLIAGGSTKADIRAEFGFRSQPS
ncbi:L-asparaginase [Mycolicibacterium agri]|uniref:L-asparaginase n=1 Tax=Mycolicibacterium agri TaxID=36811 RepID=A0A2A7MP90_MYCAG|nr:asparaginase [Mycolicibacterium agri]PEG33370.1 L-asparaginase [Mycolicibacterium agri]